jgi:hypothetical protein
VESFEAAEARSAASAAATRAGSRAAFTPDGWWRSGDLVELFTLPQSASWHLRVLGRAQRAARARRDTDACVSRRVQGWVPKLPQL